MPRWSRRRWLRRLAFGAVGVILVVGAVFGWALLSTDSSTIARALVWMEADVGDQHRFPARAIPAGEAASPLPAGGEAKLPAPDLADRGGALDDLVGETDTHAFVIAHEDRLVYQRYLCGSDRGTLETSFSMSSGIRYTESGLPWSGDDTSTTGSTCAR